MFVSVLVLAVASFSACGGYDECDGRSDCLPDATAPASTLTVLALTPSSTREPFSTPTPRQSPSVISTVLPPTPTPIPVSTIGRTGISGIVLVGPQCPVVREDEPCPDKPYEADIDVYDASGALVTRVRSDAAGEFFVELASGAYRLEPRSPAVLPYASPVDVIVVDGRTTSVVVSYASGIR